jgi:hypothetical protein
MDPMMMGNGDVLGDGVLGDPEQGASPEDSQLAGEQMIAEQEIKTKLVNEAYGEKPPPKRLIDKD